VFSFLALREFITLVHTRRGDHRSLILAFFVVLPLQYLLVGLRTSTCSRSSSRSTCSWPSRWSARWPATRRDSWSATPRSSGASWSASIGLSHAPALLLLDLPRFGGRGAFLLFFW
jgi:phosphatidate cytidylyltransferase